MGQGDTEHVGAARLIRFEEIDSTNAEALRRAAAGDRGNLWIVAGRQTQGRGRRARPWMSAEGNLHASLLMRPRLPVPVAGQLSFVAALALFDAVADCASGLAPALKLKWPNDLLLGGAKVAGILLESLGGEGGRLDTLVIGFGVNCRHHPADTPFPATDLAVAGAHVTPSALVAALAARFEEAVATWDEGADFERIRRAWLARATGLGERITVRLGSGRELAGTFADLDAQGSLVLRAADGSERAVAAGDVFFAGGEGS